MNGKEVRSWLARSLIGIAEPQEVKSMLQWWLEFRLGWKASDWLLKEEEPVSAEKLVQIHADLAELQTGKPLHYVLGEAWFAGKRFLVDQNVLIPRPETEELIDWILADWPDKIGFRVIDLGCGSGIIPISLKLARPNWDIVGADVSLSALAVAQHNAVLHQTELEWLEMDMLNNILPGNFDLVISNPPYIPQKEAATMTRQVVDFEPGLALFVPDEAPLLFYRRIAALAKNQKILKAIYLELHKNKALETSALFEVYSSKKVIQKDLNGHDRMLRIIYDAG